MNRPAVTMRSLSSISNKLLAVLVAVAILPAVTVSIYAFRRGTEAIADQALSDLTDSTVNHARWLEDHLSAIHDSLQELAGSERLIDYCAAVASMENLNSEVADPRCAGQRRTVGCATTQNVH